MNNQISVSKMSGKLEGLQGINTNPLDNKFCEAMSKTDSICAYCYSRRMVKTYRKSASKCWSNNGDVLSTTNIEIPKIKADIIRFHAHGELLNRKHYENFMAIATAYPNKKFALWTKRKNLVKGEKPKNLTLVYSNKIVDKPIDVPKGFDKVFNVMSTPDIVPINCAGKKCIECQLCYGSGVKVINELLRK